MRRQNTISADVNICNVSTNKPKVENCIIVEIEISHDHALSRHRRLSDKGKSSGAIDNCSVVTQATSEHGTK